MRTIPFCVEYTFRVAIPYVNSGVRDDVLGTLEDDLQDLPRCETAVVDYVTGYAMARFGVFAVSLLEAHEKARKELGVPLACIDQEHHGITMESCTIRRL